jgi:pSer/pThr/pTyr-binding forkhead associated (FHA) protein
LTREIVLGRLPVTVGRGVDAEVALDDHSVSRRHCVIYEMAGMLEVRDLGSRNGTFVNGLGIAKARMMPRDKLTIGTRTFVVDYELAAAKSRESFEDETTCVSHRRLTRSKTASSSVSGTWFLASSATHHKHSGSFTPPGDCNRHRSGRPGTISSTGE